MTRSFGIVALLLACSATSFAQGVQTGTIRGTVKDQQGLALPGATITIINASTRVARESVANTGGLYSIPALDPGTYDVRAVLSGFAPTLKRGVGLLTGSTLIGFAAWIVTAFMERGSDMDDGGSGRSGTQIPCRRPVGRQGR